MLEIVCLSSLLYLYIGLTSVAFRFEGPQVRLVLNEATYPLTPCIQSARDAKYGTCSLSNFIQSNQFSMSIEFGDAQWAASCGVPA